jgi:hypothetical protein
VAAPGQIVPVHAIGHGFHQISRVIYRRQPVFYRKLDKLFSLRIEHGIPSTRIASTPPLVAVRNAVSIASGPAGLRDDKEPERVIKE